MSGDVSQALRQVRNARSEDDVRSALQRALMAASGGVWSLEVGSSDGSVDMVSQASRILIETKAPGRAHPGKPGAKPGESQQQQVERYLHALAPDRAQEGDPDWRGFLTDGVIWWGWEWCGWRRRLLPIREVQGRSTPETMVEFDRFVADILGVAQRKGPEPPPENLAEALFDPLLARVTVLQGHLESEAVYRTRLGLWASLLEGSGIAPPGDTPLAQARTFAKHSLLVATARILIGCLDSPRATATTLVDRASGGFQGWLAETPSGRELLSEVVDQVRAYDWRGSTKDVLKDAYHGLIDAEDRKVFGEFYTPDDLAKLVVDEVLDDAWCDAAIQAASHLLQVPGQAEESRHLGVLDPSCGSGTFLFHAARRLGRRILLAHKSLLGRSAEIVSMLVNGVDLHPVAVEMARATLSMALPQSASAGPPHLRVVLGDAMRTHEMQIDRGLGVRLRTPAGRTLWIPGSLALHPDRGELIQRIVAGAGDAGASSRDWVADLVDDQTAKDAEQLRQELASVVAAEGDHVWGWHLLNNVDLFQLGQQGVGRLIGNPPWLVSPYTPEGPRKDAIEEMRIQEGVKPTRRTSARGDLASVFTARVTRLYLSDEKGSNRYGWVLPGSALINDVWKPWRSGRWAGVAVRHTEAWNLDDVEPPVFAHAPNGTCVVLGERVSPRADGVERVLKWRGPLEIAEVVELSKRPSKTSLYEPEFRVGALSKPQPLLLAVEVDHVDGDLAKVRTKFGTKKPWKGIEIEGVIESETLLPIVRSQELEAFMVTPACTFLIAPRDGQTIRNLTVDEDARTRLPSTFEFWKRAEAIYQERRTAKAGKTLGDNLDFKGTLTNQLAKSGSEPRKVLYNASGKVLRAARVAVEQIGNQKTYWAVFDSEEEALYVCGVLNARCMQDAWSEGKTSKLDFDKSLWRHVPVPKFDPDSAAHRQVARIALEAEDGLTEAVWQELDAAVGRLLPDYASNITTTEDAG